MLNRLHQRLPHLVAIVFTFALVGPAAWIAGSIQQASGGYVLERDAEIALEEPGTHGGGGKTIGYSFFKKTPNLKLVFRKRALKPGSAIGYHLQKEDEIYYVLSGRGEMTIDGKSVRDEARRCDSYPSRGVTRPQTGWR